MKQPESLSDSEQEFVSFLDELTEKEYAQLIGSFPESKAQKINGYVS